MLFFDSSDLTPDGIRRRTTLPGGDSLTIAGVSFDSLLDTSFWSFSFEGGEPACFDVGLGACGTGVSQINAEDRDNPYPAISFTDEFIGTAFDGDQRSLGFSYSLTIVPLPPALYLFGAALLGLAGIRQRG